MYPTYTFNPEKDNYADLLYNHLPDSKLIPINTGKLKQSCACGA